MKLPSGCTPVNTLWIDSRLVAIVLAEPQLNSYRGLERYSCQCIVSSFGWH